MSKTNDKKNFKPTIVPDTPRSQKSFGQDIGIVQLRPYIAKEMDGEFIRCPVDNFISTYLPFAPDNDVTEHFIKKLLQDIPTGTPGTTGYNNRAGTKPKSSILVGDEKNTWFRKYGKGRITKTSHGTEIVTFGPWEEIFRAIGDIEYPNKDIQDPQKQRQRNQYTYTNVPTKQIESNIPGSNNLIDAALLGPRVDLKKLQTKDIAVVVEHKRTLDKIRENALQAVSANVQIMNDDARRMHTFGITAECDEITLWFHSRSHSAVSERFSFTGEPKTFIKIAIAFLFATEELGYDSTVTLETNGQYIYKLPTPADPQRFEQFRTIEPLSQYRSNNITGRMARVYKVIKLDESGNPTGEPLVLKDVWLDKSAKTEQEIQTTIFKDIENFWAKSDGPAELKQMKEDHAQLVRTKKYKEYFLTILQDYAGKITTDQATNGTPEKEILADPLPMSHVPRTGTNSQLSQYADSEATIDTHPIESQVPKPHEFPRAFSQKKQYRVIFKEVCKTVGKLEALGDVVSVLFQTLTPLQLLLCAGWVHRDISSGNILAYGSSGKWIVKLSDIEYAKKFPSLPGSPRAVDPKTGTPYFMPLEILEGIYLYNPRYDKGLLPPAADSTSVTKTASLNTSTASSGAQEDELDEFDRDLAAEAEKRVTEAGGDIPSTTVVHNFQHDLESVWWILLWTVCCRMELTPSTQALQDYAKLVFVNELKPSKQRILCLTSETFSHIFGPKIPNRALPLLDILSVLRRKLLDSYIDRGRKRAYEELGSYADIHSYFFKAFKKLDLQVKEASLDVRMNDIHWASIHLPAKLAFKAIASKAASSIKDPERKRGRADEDGIDPRAVQQEGRSRAKQPKKSGSLKRKGRV